MATISFKTDEELKARLETLAKKKGINTSAYIKIILVKGINEDLIAMTENGLTVAEELQILSSDAHDKTYGPFTTKKTLMKALKKK